MFQMFIENIVQGIYHILNPNAFDHLLIIVVLTISYNFKNWKQVVLLTFLIALAHLLTIILTTNNLIQASSFSSQTLYYLPIFVIGVHNIVINGKKPGRKTFGILVLSALTFGFFHGVFFTLEMSSQKLTFFTSMAMSLGLFLGQLIVAFFVLFLSYISQIIFRWSERDWVMITSALITGMTIILITLS